MYQSEYLQISHTNRPLESMINIISWKCIWQFVDCIISQMHKCITLCFISSWLNQRTHHILTIHITSWIYIERGSDNITPHYKHIPHVVCVCINGIVHYIVLIQYRHVSPVQPPINPFYILTYSCICFIPRFPVLVDNTAMWRILPIHHEIHKYAMVSHSI